MKAEFPPWPNKWEKQYRWPDGAFAEASFEAALPRLAYAIHNFEQAAKTLEQAGYPIAAGAMRDVIRDIGPLPGGETLMEKIKNG